MIKNKDKLISLVCTALRNFVLGHLAIFQIEKDPGIPKSVTFYTDNETVAVPVKDLFIDKNTGNLISNREIFENFKNSLSRSIIAENFELIKNYCKETNQLSTFKSWKHYNFNRVIRNCTSHGTGGTLHMWPPDLDKEKIDEVKWKSRCISKTMVGNSVYMLNNQEIIRFTYDQLDFIKEKLK